MSMFYQMAVAVAVFMVVVGGAIWAVIAWIGRGESDVNGDPERDAGLLPEAPVKRLVCWGCDAVVPAGFGPATHGLCQECLAKWKREPELPRVICMDCGVLLRAGPEPVSHGLCLECLEKRKAELVTVYGVNLESQNSN